jgi:hypothetical protein
VCFTRPPSPSMAAAVQGSLLASGLEDAPSEEESSLQDKPALQRLERRGS